MDEAPLTVDVPEGPRLEARIALPASPAGGLVVCHPHPLYGGDMDNPVVIRCAEVAWGLGLATLRFNFRGVGASTGPRDGKGAEQADVRAGLAALAARVGVGCRIALAGYSFGAWISARVAGEDPAALAGLCLVAPPLSMLDVSAVPAIHPTLVVAGSRDQYCPVDALEDLGRRMPAATITVIEGADHFFFGKLFPLSSAVETWCQNVIGAAA